jgi:hypothetical protein
MAQTQLPGFLGHRCLSRATGLLVKDRSKNLSSSSRASELSQKDNPIQKKTWRARCALANGFSTSASILVSADTSRIR